MRILLKPFTLMLLALFGLSGMVSAQNKKLGLYILCSNQDSEKDDPFYNRYVGNMVNHYLATEMSGRKTDVFLMNKLAPKYKVFDKFAKSFYINEAYIDSVGHKQGCYRVMILYFGYSKKVAKAEEVNVYDKIAFYGVMADPTVSKGKQQRVLSYKRYLKGHQLGMGPISLMNMDYYKDFLLSAVKSVKVE